MFPQINSCAIQHKRRPLRIRTALNQAAAFTTDPANATEVTADIAADAPPTKIFKYDPTAAPAYAPSFYAVTMTPGCAG